MCNRYANKSTITELRALMRYLEYELATTAATDNLPIQDVYPDQDAAIIRVVDDGIAQLASLRWGFPEVAKGKRPITNIRNLDSSWWRIVNGQYLLEPEYRCLVPFSAFAEPPYKPTWFSVPDREVAFFAGIWRPWHGERLVPVDGKKKRQRVEGDYELFSFLTTDPNDIIRPVHEKAMPVILTEPGEWADWLGGGRDSLHLQRPLPNHMLKISADPLNEYN